MAGAARGTGDPSVYRTGVFLQRIQDSADAAPRRDPSSLPDDWKQSQIAWIFSLAIVMLGVSAATFGKWLEGAGPRKAMFAVGGVFCAWVLCFLSRRDYASAVADLFGIWSHRRNRAWAWIYFAGFDADQMVSRSSRTGNRHGDHGIRRRSDDRVTTGDQTDGLFPYAGDVGVGKTFLVMGTLYFLLHDVRSVHHPSAARRLEAGKLDAHRQAAGDDHDAQCGRQYGVWDQAVLAACGSCCART